MRFWIQSQLDHVEALKFGLEGKDRQILSGYVPKVSLTVDKAVYRGLHLSRVNAAATEIRFNLGQILRGKPLRLLQPFPVQGHVCLFAEDLRASLNSSLLAQGLQDVLQRLVNAHPDLFPKAHHLRELIADFSKVSATTAVDLDQNQITLAWKPDDPTAEQVMLSTGLDIRAGHLLYLLQPEVRMDPDAHRGESGPVRLDDFVIDLGSEVEIQALTVKQTFIEIEGMVKVIPAN